MFLTHKILYLGIDIQKAFGQEAASPKLATLARPPEGDEATEIFNNVQLLLAIYAVGGTVVVTRDCHNPLGTQVEVGGQFWVDNRATEEFAVYGEHATPDNGDSEFNPPLEAALRELEIKEGHRRTILPVDEYERVDSGDSQRIFEMHKNVYDITLYQELQDGAAAGPLRSNEAFWSLLGDKMGDSSLTVVLGGKIAEVCVRAAALSLLARFPQLDLLVVEDAVSSLPYAMARHLKLLSRPEVMEQLRLKGARISDTQTILSALLSQQRG